MSLLSGLRDALQKRKAQGLYRRRRVVEGPQQVRLKVDGRELLSFCSNDYLGLASDQRIAESLRKASKRYGSGSGAAHLISGHSEEHHALEEELAAFLGRERALLFSTGYMANLGVIAGLMQRGDTLIQDKWNHASLMDAAQLSAANHRRYPHVDMGVLQQRLQEASGNKLVVTDGVFSMDGDQAPLVEMAQHCAAHDAVLMVDDAHGFGVLGPQGCGSAAQLGLDANQLPIYMATLGKALGVSGAFVAGSETLVETLIQQARPYVYTTAMPAALAAATRSSLQLMAEEDWRRQQLQSLITRFRREALAMGLNLMASETPIQPVLLGDAHTALAWSEALMEKGIWVAAIRPPTVPQGTARLRITFSAQHTDEHLDELLQALFELSRKVAP